MRFTGKVVLVTGAASGIGHAVITAFVKKGAKGAIVDMDDSWAKMVAEHLRAEGGDMMVSITDVSSPSYAGLLRSAKRIQGCRPSICRAKRKLC